MTIWHPVAPPSQTAAHNLPHNLPHKRPPPPQVLMNPFHSPTTKITSKEFDKKVKVAAKRTLG